MKRKGRGLILAGTALIAAAGLLVCFNLRESERAGEHAAAIVSILADMHSDSYPDPDLDSDSEYRTDSERFYPEQELPTKEIDGVSYVGILQIPVLGLEHPVINTWSYPNLRLAPCRYFGSPYQGNLVICAHNYDSHFGNLKKLQSGDEVIFTDLDGNEFLYTTADWENLQPSDTEAMTAGDWALTLFTCTVGGQSRVVVRCSSAQ